MSEQPPELFGHLTEKPGFAARPETGIGHDGAPPF